MIPIRAFGMAINLSEQGYSRFQQFCSRFVKTVNKAPHKCFHSIAPLPHFYLAEIKVYVDTRSPHAFIQRAVGWTSSAFA
jgi:hypothetical protein